MNALITVVTALFLLPCLSVLAEETRSGAKEIVLGMSTALEGPAARLGINMRDGVLAALKEANAKGGHGGRPFRLVVLDDGYEPSRTAPNMKALVGKHRVLAVVGNVGTPTAVAAVPVALAEKVPFWGAYTGAGILRKSPPDRYVLNFRASYAEETAAMVEALIKYGRVKKEEIAFFTQRDSYGDAGFVGGLAALRRHGLSSSKRVAHGRYERNTLSVENGLADLMEAVTPVKAVIMVGAYASCAKFVKLARKVGLKARFLNVSFVGAIPMAKLLGKDGDGVIVTQVLPHFLHQRKTAGEQRRAPIVGEYRAALNKWLPQSKANFGSLEGYVSTRILLMAFQRVKGQPTRETLIDALESLGNFDVGLGIPLQLSPTDHQASHHVWPTVLKGGKVLPMDWKELGDLAN